MTMTGTWGSVWLSDGKVYMASNGGTIGVYLVDVDLVAKSAETTPVALSAATNLNDGMNCLVRLLL